MCLQVKAPAAPSTERSSKRGACLEHGVGNTVPSKYLGENLPFIYRLLDAAGMPGFGTEIRAPRVCSQAPKPRVASCELRVASCELRVASCEAAGICVVAFTPDASPMRLPCNGDGWILEAECVSWRCGRPQYRGRVSPELRMRNLRTRSRSTESRRSSRHTKVRPHHCPRPWSTKR